MLPQNSRTDSQDVAEGDFSALAVKEISRGADETNDGLSTREGHSVSSVKLDRDTLDTVDSSTKRPRKFQQETSSLTALQDMNKAGVAVDTRSLSRPRLLALPDEVILCILSDDALLPDNDPMHTLSKYLPLVAGVCSRFRDIVHSHAPFWASINNHQHPNEVEVYLSRSKRAPLKIRFQLCVNDPEKGEAFFHKVMEHRDRWRTLSINYFRCRDTRWVYERSIHALLWAEHSFPVLESLTVTLPSTNLLRRNSVDVESTTMRCHPYTKWRIPRLRSLITIDSLPRTCLPVRLTTCCIVLISKTWFHSADPMSAFLEFLAGQPLLEELHFSLKCFPARTAYLIGVPIEMAQLRSMSAGLTEDLSSETFRAYASILQSIKVPKLNNLSLVAPIMEDREWESLLPHFNDYNDVRKLFISTSSDGRRLENEISFPPFQLISRRFRNLKHLEVDSDHVALLDTVSPSCAAVDPPPLQSLKISTDSTFTSESLLAIIQYLRRGHQWDQFRQMEVKGCKHLLDESGWLNQLPKCRLLVHCDNYGNKYRVKSTYFEVCFEHEGETQPTSPL